MRTGCIEPSDDIISIFQGILLKNDISTANQIANCHRLINETVSDQEVNSCNRNGNKTTVFKFRGVAFFLCFVLVFWRTIFAYFFFFDLLVCHLCPARALFYVKKF